MTVFVHMRPKNSATDLANRVASLAQADGRLFGANAMQTQREGCKSQAIRC